MAADVEMRVTHQENDGKPANGFACNFESLKTPEEIKAEKRFVRKIDFMILPLLAISLFLASLVRTALLSVFCRTTGKGEGSDR